MFSYRIGFPCWKLAVMLGIPLKVKIDTHWDDDAKVFVASSNDFLPEFACVAEADTWDELRQKLDNIFEDALEGIFRKPVHATIKPFFVQEPI